MDFNDLLWHNLTVYSIYFCVFLQQIVYQSTSVAPKLRFLKEISSNMDRQIRDCQCVILRFISSFNSLFKVYKRNGCHKLIHECSKRNTEEAWLSAAMFMYPGWHLKDALCHSCPGTKQDCALLNSKIQEFPAVTFSTYR